MDLTANNPFAQQMENIYSSLQINQVDQVALISGMPL